MTCMSNVYTPTLLHSYTTLNLRKLNKVTSHLSLLTSHLSLFAPLSPRLALFLDVIATC